MFSGRSVPSGRTTYIPIGRPFAVHSGERPRSCFCPSSYSTRILVGEVGFEPTTDLKGSPVLRTGAAITVSASRPKLVHRAGFEPANPLRGPDLQSGGFSLSPTCTFHHKNQKPLISERLVRTGF